MKVAELENKFAKERELRLMYRKRMERTQDYLRYCLQVAQENGFLDLILHNKDHADFVNNASPQLPTSPLHLHQHQHQHHQPSDLDTLIDQSKLNGWYINPDEVFVLYFCF